MSPTAWGQTAVDAGSVRQQLEREQPNSQRLPTVDVEKKIAKPQAGPDQQRITISGFRFIGNKLLDGAELSAITAAYVNTPVSFDDLRDAADAVADHYRESGWVVNARLPQQDISDGTVTIEVVEARFAGATLAGYTSSRIANDSLLLNIFTVNQQVGEPLQTAKLDRALLLANDLPGVNVKGRLTPGPAVGDSLLRVYTVDDALITADISIDNHGLRSTGEERALANLYLNSPFGRGGLVSVNSLYAEGTAYGRLSYTLPVGGDGWRLGASGSYFDYEVVIPEFSQLDSEGSSASGGLEASYPIIRSQQHNLYLLLNYDYSKFRNRANHETISGLFAQQSKRQSLR